MTKAMTKYQLDHFRSKVKRQFNPLIQDQELLVKQFTTEATDKAVDKLSKKIGADTIIKKFKEAWKEKENNSPSWFQEFDSGVATKKSKS